VTILPRNAILVGDALTRLQELPPASVDTCITSPPYFQLRDYGASGQLGLEPTVEQWVAGLMSVSREVARVLKGSGSLWLNLGDSYSRASRYGAPPKSLLLGPERLLLALARDGWIIRNKVIWAKTNPMPHSVTDRLNTTYDVVYFLVRSRRYYFNLDQIREPHQSRCGRRASSRPDRRPAGWAGPLAGQQDGLHRARADGVPGHWLGKNPGDVWRIAGSNYRGAHFATFPQGLVERPLLATCPERVCPRCAAPWRRSVTVRRLGVVSSAGRKRHVRRYPTRWETVRQVGELESGCSCPASPLPGVVLDPFFGTGTVGVVAERHGRDWIGIELNPEYVALAEERLRLGRVSGGATRPAKVAA
jgi:DNA modification methylase